MKPVLTALLVLSFVLPHGTVAADEGSETDDTTRSDAAIADLAKLIHQVIKNFAPPRPNVQPARRPLPVARAQPAAVMVDAVGVEENMEVRLKARGQRLEVHAAAFSDWAVRVCELSQQQQTTLDENLAQQLVKLQDRWKRNAHRHNTPVSDYAPVSFTTFGGAGNFLSRRRVAPLLKQALTDEQCAVLLAAYDKRLEAIRSDMLTFAIYLIDKELFLATGQREQLTERLRDGINNVEDGVFTFNTRNYYLPYTQLSQAVHVLPDTLLTDVQRLRLNNAFDATTQGSNSVVFSTGTMDSWPQQLDDATGEVQALFINAAELQASWLQETVDLSPQLARHLTIAGKGSAMQSAAAWKKSAAAELAQWKDRAAQQRIGRNFRFGVSLPPTDGLDQNPLWRHAVDKCGAADASHERSEFHRTAAVGYLTAMLDKELWLSHDQREAITPLVAAAVPETLSENQDQVREWELLVIPLFRIPGDAIAGLLTQPQQSAWKELQAQFEVNGRSVTMRMQRGNQVQFMLPP